MGRTHAVAAVIVDAAYQDAGGASEPYLPGNRIAGELGLDGLEHVAVEDRLMLSGVNLAPVQDLAAVLLLDFFELG
jgi:hypothetical protein